MSGSLVILAMRAGGLEPCLFKRILELSPLLQVLFPIAMPGAQQVITHHTARDGMILPKTPFDWKAELGSAFNSAYNAHSATSPTSLHLGSMDIQLMSRSVVSEEV